MTKSGFYFENLDGFRAIAALSVVLFHCVAWLPVPETTYYHYLSFLLSLGGYGGGMGVTFFFILSGFLITYLMCAEFDKNENIDILFFYFKRIIRIWPLYFFTIIIGFLIYPMLLHYSGIAFEEKANALLYALFAANFDHIYFQNPSVGILGVQWSVGVEEQFYLIWPIVFLFFMKRKIFVPFLIVIFLLSEIFFIKSSTWAMAYYSLMSNIRFFAVGGLLAYFCFHRKDLIHLVLSRIGYKLNITIYVICALILFLQGIISAKVPELKIFIQLVPIIFFPYVILEQNYSSTSFFKIGSIPVLNWLGKISYGLYLNHMIIIYFALYLFEHVFFVCIELQILFVVVFTILFSHLSYQYFETFFLEKRNQFPSIRQYFSRKP